VTAGPVGRQPIYPIATAIAVGHQRPYLLARVGHHFPCSAIRQSTRAQFIEPLQDIPGGSRPCCQKWWSQALPAGICLSLGVKKCCWSVDTRIHHHTGACCPRRPRARRSLIRQMGAQFCQGAAAHAQLSVLLCRGRWAEHSGAAQQYAIQNATGR
jgi:hypothetical protein